MTLGVIVACRGVALDTSERSFGSWDDTEREGKGRGCKWMRRKEGNAMSISENNGLNTPTQISEALLRASSFRTEVVYWLSLTARVGEI
jgi:hypothetical protein